jgi:hypothetical protein
MTHTERHELNALSKQVFGTSSRWQKIVQNGVSEPYSRDREVMVPGPNGIQKKTFTDTKNVIRRYTVDEVRTLMQGILAQSNALVHNVTENAAGLPEGTTVA